MAAGVAFISNILTARALGPELRGNIAFVLQASYFLAPVLVVASDRALLRSGRDDGDGFHVVGRKWLAIGGTVATIVLFAGFQDWRALIAPGAVVTGWFLLRRAEVLSHGGYRRYLRPFLMFQATILTSHLFLYFLGITAWQWWLAAYVVPALVLLPISPSSRPGRSAPPRSNLPLLAGSLAKLWSLRGERLILPLIAGPSSLGLYVVVATATEPLFWVAQSLADHNVSHEPPANTRGRVRQLTLLCAPFALGATLIGLAVWWLVEPIFGSDFADAKPLVLPLALASVALAAYRLVSGWVLASARPAGVGRFETTVATVAAVAYPVGVLLAAAPGAAWATLVVYSSAVVLGLAPSLHPQTTTWSVT